MTIMDKALYLRAQIEKNAATMDDEEAVEYSELFPTWSGDGISYAVGDRVLHRGTLYKCLIANRSQEDWNPDAAPSLWAKVLIPDPEFVPDWEQPDSTNPYMTGDLVRFEGSVYESLIDNNIWSPAAYPAGWKFI